MIQNPSMTLHDGTIVIRRVVRPQPDWNDGVLVLDFLVVTPSRCGMVVAWSNRRLAAYQLSHSKGLLRSSGSVEGRMTLRTCERLREGLHPYSTMPARMTKLTRTECFGR